MKVVANASTVQLNAYIKRARHQQQPQDPLTNQLQNQQVAGSNKVDISQQAKEAQQAMQTLKTKSDTRFEKVARVKMDIENGTYKVSGERVATGMLKEAFENNTIFVKINTKA